MHILVPVLPLLAADFGVSRGTIQLAITLYCSALPAANCRTARSPTSLAGGRPCWSPLVSISWRARLPAGRRDRDLADRADRAGGGRPWRIGAGPRDRARQGR